ncbi:MAG: methyltransferase domain-containing protein [bacterium]|nr:methyltransferase domain-containing protein [bacterium]
MNSGSLQNPQGDSSATELGRFIPQHYHYQMLLDEARMLGFRTALELVVPVGGRVLELGTGTGVLSFFAARSGAEKVWCVERQPDLAERARQLLAANGVDDRVEVVTGDAFEYLPPEPVDVVVCEMLHSALLRESQVRMLAEFRARYTERFGPQLPVFVPQATLLGIEAIEFDFDFFDYRAPLPLFEDPSNPSNRLKTLGPVTPYKIVDYMNAPVESIAYQGPLGIEIAGQCKALRFVTKNILAIDPDAAQNSEAPGAGSPRGEHGIVEWMNQNLIVPLPEALNVAAGQALSVGFAYQPGDEIEVLLSTLTVASTD